LGAGVAFLKGLEARDPALIANGKSYTGLTRTDVIGSAAFQPKMARPFCQPDGGGKIIIFILFYYLIN
jgi:hypothetical protein